MHICSSLIVSCIDFRIQFFVEDWARKNLGEKNYDRVGWAGGVLKLDEIMGQIDISVRLHGIKKVILMNHEDCGAYLPAEKHPTSRERIVLRQLAEGERQAKAGGQAGTEEKHRQDLLTAVHRIKDKYPDLSVETYFVKLFGEIAPC